MMRKLKRNKGTARRGDGWPKKLKPKFGKRPNLMDKFVKDMVANSKTLKKRSKPVPATEREKELQQQLDDLRKIEGLFNLERESLRNRIEKLTVELSLWQKAHWRAIRAAPQTSSKRRNDST
jgi:hypothetical protein